LHQRQASAPATGALLQPKPHAPRSQVVNYDSRPKQVTVGLHCPAPSNSSSSSSTAEAAGCGGAGRRRPALLAGAKWLLITSASPGDGNSYEAPLEVSPQERTLELQAPGDGSFTLVVPPWSVNLVLLQASQGAALPGQ
jgi:hypothetical protein